MKISVLIPLYNCAQYLKASLRSVLEQSYKDLEVIIIDNNSTDDPLPIIKSFNDNRINYYNIERSTLANTLNYGLSKCTCDIVARMDADDLMMQTRLEKQVNAFQGSPENLILSTWYGIFENEKLLYTVKTSTDDKSIKKRMALHGELIHSGVMYNKNFIIDSGGYDSKIKIEDYELWLRLSSKAKFLNIPEILTLVRYRPGSISWSNLEIKNKEIYAYQEKYYSEDSLSSIGYSIKNEQNIVKGWREYFYGNRTNARQHWKLSSILSHPRLAMAYLTTFLSDPMLVKFKESRLRFRLKYFFTYLSKENKNIRTQLKYLLRP